MATYRALRPLFIGLATSSRRRLITAGEEFESNDVPGRNWEPLDEAAKAAIAARDGATDPDAAPTVRAPIDRLDNTPADPAAVTIPEEWEAMNGAKRRALAQRLGAQNTIKLAAADDMIRAEVERRAPQPA